MAFVRLLLNCIVIVNSYLRFKVQLPTSDSTEITAGGIKVTLEGPVPVDAPLAEKYICTKCGYLTIYNCVFSFSFLAPVVSEILCGPKITLGGHVPP